MLGLIYSIASYFGFLATFVYFAWFTDGRGVPKTVDSGTESGLAATLIVDLGLLLLFGLQHSLMARPRFKRILTRLIPETVERASYVLASSAALLLLIWQWRPLPTVLWSIENPLVSALLWGVNAIGWLGVPAVTFMIDHFNLFGVKQALGAFRKMSFKQTGFVTPLLYKYVRHPMMSSLLIALWVTPHLTVGHLLLSAGMSLYIVIGVHFEERALARELGVAYQAYQASTPKFLPLSGPRPALGDTLMSSPESRRGA